MLFLAVGSASFAALPVRSRYLFLDQLAEPRGIPASLFPETSFSEVSGIDGGTSYFTMLRESSHTNVAQLLE